MAKVPYRIYLSEEEIPKNWYNLRADMKEPHDPLISPATHEPLKKEDLYPIFCEDLAAQEMDYTTRYFPIPEEIREFYKIYRPLPCAAPTIWRRPLGRRQKFTTNLRGTTPPAATS